MRTDRISNKKEGTLSFSRSQVYLILGCVMVIALLSFSLGAIISEDEPEEQKAEDSVATEDGSAHEQLTIDDAMPEGDATPEGGEVGIGEDEEQQLLTMTGIAAETESLEEPMDTEQAALLAAEETSAKIKQDKNVVEVQVSPNAKKIKREPAKRKPLSVMVAKSLTTKLNKQVNVTKQKSKTAVTLKNSKKSAVPVTAASAPLPSSRVKATEVASVAPTDVGEKISPRVNSLMAKKPTGKSKYTVQVAIFTTKVKANSAAKKLIAKGYAAYTERYLASRSIYYRLKVGGYDRKIDADMVAVTMRNREGYEAHSAPYKR